MSFFGYWGFFQHAEEGFGILLSSDGLIDIAYDSDLKHEYRRSNILERKIMAGEYVTFFWKEEGAETESTYEAEALADLVGNRW